jgi:hypothetical protein
MKTKCFKIVAIMVAWLLMQLGGHAQELQVIDKSGVTNEIHLQYIAIDYTVVPDFGSYTHDLEYSGIRARQGDAIIVIPWEKIQFVSMESGTNAQISLTSGIKKNVELSKFNVGVLVGNTDIGSLKVKLESIRTIQILPKK